MKVLIVNTSDIGGAANACLRLHEGLLNCGIDSKVILMRKHKHIPATYKVMPLRKKFLKRMSLAVKKLFWELGLKTKKKTKEQEFLASREKRLELFSFPFSEYDITQNKWYKEADVVNLHWVSDFLDYESFFNSNNKPVVWTMHDMNVFTGGEHYTESIVNMDDEGNPVPRTKTDKESGLSKFYENYKANLLKDKNNISFVAPSKWLLNEAQNSIILKNKNIKHIPYGLNKEVFNIRDKTYSRGLLNIPKDKRVILFVAESLHNTQRKGFNFLIKAFENLEDKNVILCAVGSKKVALSDIENLIELGVINDDRMMSVAYSSADVFVIPSLMDNLPNTVLESLMCGTPVIGFPVGGILDMVQNNYNGYIAKDISAKSLGETLSLFLKTKEVFNSANIRKEAVKKYDLEVQSRKYIDLYKDMLN